MTNLWLTTWLKVGFTLLAPDVFDATPEILKGWTLRVEGTTVICGTSDVTLFEGKLPTPRPWLESIVSERQCLVVVVGIGVDSNEIGNGASVALNMLASKGFVGGATVGVTGTLGLNTALGMESALVEARNMEFLTKLSNDGNRLQRQ